nr:MULTISPECIES: aldo/keto reductase [unclassified Haladaptatus]
MCMSAMEYTTLGETGLEVSRLCLGCMNFGSGQPWMINNHEQSHDVIDRALELGINFLDTANVYSHGESEEIVGEALSGRRDEVVLATKVFSKVADRPNGQGLSRRHILEQVEASLDRLGTDYIDLYQIHRWDDETPITETLSALDTLVSQGKVRYVGASTMPAWKFTKALYESDLNNFERFVSMQAEYNLVDRHEEANVLPTCRSEGIGVVPWSPLAGGFLTGKYERGADVTEGRAAGDEFMQKRFTEENWTVLDEVRTVAEEKGVTESQVSLAWLLHKEVVDAPIIGPRTVQHLEESVNALEVSLSDEKIERLEAPKTPVWNPEIGDV